MIDTVLFNTPKKVPTKSLASSKVASEAASKKSNAISDDYGMSTPLNKAASRFQMEMLRKAMRSTWNPEQANLDTKE